MLRPHGGGKPPMPATCHRNARSSITKFGDVAVTPPILNRAFDRDARKDCALC
jgi:hypothetical protein